MLSSDMFVILEMTHDIIDAAVPKHSRKPLIYDLDVASSLPFGHGGRAHVCASVVGPEAFCETRTKDSELAILVVVGVA